MLTALQRKVLDQLKDYLRSSRVFLGGGTALTLKYAHRPSYDLDFFTWEETWEKFSDEVFKRLSGLNRIIVEPVIIVEDPFTRESVKIELRRRDKSVKLLGYEIINSIPVLSDEDILGEKLYHARCSKRDVFDVKLLLEKVEDPIAVLRRKFSEPTEVILRRIKRSCPEIYKLL